MIVFQNEGLLELDFLKTMGVNVKECENPIGYFGTGLKYAIATLLRNNINVELFIGDTAYAFGTEVKTLRGKEFEFCYLYGPYDSVELPFTTDLGKDWQVWQAYRELYSNCLDEDGMVAHDVEGLVSTTDDTTTIVICENLPDVKKTFLRGQDLELLYSNDDIDIYAGESPYLYYRGIRAKDLTKNSKYTYNLKRHCDLSEDRMLVYDMDAQACIANAVCTMEDKQIIKHVIDSDSDYYEASISFGYYRHVEPKETFKEAVEEVQALNPSIRSYISSYSPPREKTPEEKRAEFKQDFISLLETHNIKVLNSVEFMSDEDEEHFLFEADDEHY